MPAQDRVGLNDADDSRIRPGWNFR